jgi:hypothetical protein
LIEVKSCVSIPVVMINCKFVNFNKLEFSRYARLRFVFTFFLSNVTWELDDLSSEWFLLKTSLEKKVGYFDALNFTLHCLVTLNCTMQRTRVLDTSSSWLDGQLALWMYEYWLVNMGKNALDIRSCKWMRPIWSKLCAVLFHNFPFSKIWEWTFALFLSMYYITLSQYTLYTRASDSEFNSVINFMPLIILNIVTSFTRILRLLNNKIFSVYTSYILKMYTDWFYWQFRIKLT